MSRSLLVAPPAAPVPLYTRLLGREPSLDPAVSALHARVQCTRAHGSLNIRRGGRPAARLLAAIMRLPRKGIAVPTVLEIARHGGQELWWRRFGDARVVGSSQSVARDGGLCERYGPVQLHLTVRAVDGGLVVRGRSATVRLVPIAWQVPRQLAPRIDACMLPVGVATVAVRVRIWVAAAGLLLAYEGEMTVDDD